MYSKVLMLKIFFYSKMDTSECRMISKISQNIYVNKSNENWND